MADTQPPEPSIIDTLTREELLEAFRLRNDECAAIMHCHDIAREICAFNLRGWRTALARAERAEGRAEELFGELEEAKQQREDAETERNCQAATDAATIAELQASLAVMTNDRDHLMKSATTATPPAAPDGAPALRPFDATVVVDGCKVTLRITNTPPEVFDKYQGIGNHICHHDGLYLLSCGDPGIYHSLESRVYAWSGILNDKVTSRDFPTPAEATAYAEKVRRLLDAANAQWAERGGQS